MERKPKLSIIIPIGPKETDLKHLNQWIDRGPSDWQWIISGVEGSESQEPIQDQLDIRFEKVFGSPGRAAQMNRASRLANGEFLWFLHCDTKWGPHLSKSITEAIQEPSPTLWFFRLKFNSDGPAWMFINELGVRIRSELLRIPFGDQGFLLNQELFWSLGGYDETAKFGEDHLLVWQAHKAGVPVRLLSDSLSTSARKYRDQGWSQVTKKHLYLTWQQAKPEFNELIKKKLQFLS